MSPDERRTSDPLSEQDQRLLARAAELLRPIARAANVARANGMWLAIFGALTLAIAAFGPDFPALTLGAAVFAVGLAERRAGGRLRNADPAAASDLARNELALLVAISAYGTLKLTVLRPSGVEIQQLIGNLLPDVDVKALLESATTLTYSVVIGVAVLYQGGMAAYYSRRKSDVARFNSEIPPWAREVVAAISESRS